MKQCLKQINVVLLIVLGCCILSCNRDGETKYLLLDLKSKKIKCLSKHLIIESVTIGSTGPDTILHIKTGNKHTKAISFTQNKNFKSYFFDSVKFIDTVKKHYHVYIDCRNLKSNEPKIFSEHYETNKFFLVKKKIRNQGYI